MYVLEFVDEVVKYLPHEFDGDVYFEFPSMSASPLSLIALLNWLFNGGDVEMI